MKKTLLVLLPCIMWLMLPLTASAQDDNDQQIQSASAQQNPRNPKKGKKNGTGIVRESEPEVRTLQDSINDLDAAMGDIKGILEGFKKRILDDQRIISEKNEALEQANATIVANNTMIAEYRGHRNRIANPMLNYITQQMVIRRFGITEQSEINNLLSMLDTMERYDIGVDDARIELRRFQNEQDLYLRANQALNQPYDKNTVSNLIREMDKYFKNHSSDNTIQQQQMQELKELLDISKAAVVFMQQMIGDVNDIIKKGTQTGFTTSDQIWPSIYNGIFLQSPDHEQFNSDLDRYTNIPWFYDQFDIYYSALKADCLSIKNNEAYKELMKLKP